MTNHITRMECTLLWVLLSPVTSNVVLVVNRRTRLCGLSSQAQLYQGTLHITLAVLPGLLELCHCDIRVNFLCTLYQGVLHITLAAIPGLLELCVDGQPTNLLVGYLLCVSLCVMMLVMVPTAISISMHVSAVILTMSFTGG